jgi:hypothetical protein
MKFFYPIHQSIIDLYVNALTLRILQEKLDEIGPQGLTEDVKMEVDTAANEFAISARRAEQLFGSPINVQYQLDTFTAQRSGDA